MLMSLCFEERLQCLIQVHEVGVTLVEDPRVRGVLLRVAAMRAGNAAIRRVLLTLTIGHLDLELDVVPDIAILPHQELD